MFNHASRKHQKDFHIGFRKIAKVFSHWLHENSKSIFILASGKIHNFHCKPNKDT